MVPSSMTRGLLVPRARMAAPSAFCSAVGAGISWSRVRSMTSVTSLAGSPWRPRIGSTVKWSNFMVSSPRPVTVLICWIGTGWVRSLSVVTAAPTSSALVRAPIDAASDMWSKWPWPIRIRSAVLMSAAATPSGGYSLPRS